MTKRGLEMLKQLEGFRAAPYQDQAGIWTIGYGSTHDADMKRVTSTTPNITAEKAEELLLRDALAAEDIVKKHVLYPLNDCQLDALTCFVYNVGHGNFEASTLLKTLNKGNLAGVPAEMNRWVYAGKRISQGLVRRRLIESELFMETNCAGQTVPLQVDVL